MILEAISRRAELPPRTDSDWRRLFGYGGAGLATQAGPAVNEWSALAHATVFACVKVLAESVGQLPLVLYERSGRARGRAEQHPLFRLVHDEPNPEMTSQEVREAMMAYLATHGNALAVIETGRGGEVEALWPIPWSEIEMGRGRDGELRYLWRPTRAEPTVLRAEQVWHVRGLSWNGLQGLSPIAIQREAIGHGLAMAEYQARFFANDATPGGVLQTDQSLDEPAVRRIAQDWDRLHQGLGRSHKVAILDHGLKWEKISLPAKDSQFLESRKLNRTEIAGWYRVPAHMVNDLEKATFSNIEHLGIEFVVHTLAPYMVRFEQSGNRQLLLRREKGRLFLKHNVDALLRGDTASRYTAYQAAIQSGWLTPNEAREKEDLNPIEGLDDPLQPLNMVPVGDDPPADPGVRQRLAARRDRRARELRSSASRRRLAQSFAGLFEDGAARVLRAEEREVRKLAERHLAETYNVEGFLEDLARLYGEDSELVRFIRSSIEPASGALVRATWAAAAAEVEGDDPDEGRVAEFVAAVVAAFAASHAGKSRGLLEEAARDGDPAEASARIDGTFETWKQERPGQIAARETVKQSRAAARAAFVASGVTLLRWVAVGDDCPMCAKLDGRVVGIEGPFVQEGETFEADGTAPITVRTPISHPPLHRGCDCDIVPQLGG